MRSRTYCLALLLAACAGAPGHEGLDRITDVPGGASAADRGTAAARRLWERGKAVEAQEALLAVLAQAPRHVDALRLRQDILRTRGRSGLLRAELEQMLREGPEDPVACYLQGRMAQGDSRKEQWFRKAKQLAPTSLWPWLGLAFSLRSRDRDPDQALPINADLGIATGRHPTVAMAEAEALRVSGRYAQALQAYQHLRNTAAMPGVGDLGIAQTLLSMDKRRESWEPLLAALHARPFDPGVRQLLRDWVVTGLPEEQVVQVLDVLGADPERMRDFGQREGVPVLASLLLRVGRAHAARELLDRSGIGPRTPALRRLHRQTMLMTGDVRAFLFALRSDLPAELLADESNQVRGLWLQLFSGPWMDGEPLATGPQSVQLAKSLRDCGLLSEALEVTALTALRWPPEPVEELRSELQRELAFEGGLRRLLYRRYAQAETPPLDQVLEEVRQLSLAVLEQDVVGEVQRFSVPLIGEMVDSFNSGLCRHLQRYNKHLVLGRRSGGLVEGMLLTRLVQRELAPSAELPLPARCFEVIGEHREIRSLSGVIGGDLAGVALLNHYLIDFDAVREWAQGIAERKRTAAQDGNAVLRDPLPAVIAELESLDVPWRLAAVSQVEDSGLDLAVLDMIRHHERAHLVDSFYYLPFESNLFRVTGLLFRFLFSADAIEAEMERRAELAALALSSHPELVLSHIADFLDAPGGSPHSDGFRRLAGDMEAQLVRLGVPAPEAAPCRWHLLPTAKVREAASNLLTRLR